MSDVERDHKRYYLIMYERFFARNQYPTKEEREALADATERTEKQVQTYFDHKRHSNKIKGGFVQKHHNNRASNIRFSEETKNMLEEFYQQNKHRKRIPNLGF